MAVQFHFEGPLGRWGFVRGAEQVVIDRLETTALLISFNNQPPQVMEFSDASEALMFHVNIESELRRNGWTLAVFESRIAEERPRAYLVG